VNTAPCTKAGCCTACAAGRHWNPDGFCIQPHPPPRKQANIVLALPTHQPALDAVTAVLKANRASFTGIAYQYFGVCGEGSKDCAPQDSLGPPHFAPGHQGLPAAASPIDLARTLRAALGADLQLFPMISFGDTTNTSLLNRLLASDELQEAFIADAVKYCLANNITGMNWDLEPTAPYKDPQAFLARFTRALNKHGLENTWDSNGLEGVMYRVGQWVDMGTYYSGDSYQDTMKRGLFGVGAERYGLGYCPSCQVLNESAVQQRFDVLTESPGNQIRRVWLWAVYGEGGSFPYEDYWEYYWPRLAVWLHA